MNRIGWVMLLLPITGCVREPGSAMAEPEGVSVELAYEIPPDKFGGSVDMSSFALSPDGVVAIIDPYDPGVIFYAEWMGDTARVGREGEGPGEFRGARNLVFVDASRLAVYDRALGRLSLWRLPAEHITDVQLTPDLAALTVSNGAILAARGLRGERGLADGSFSILRIDPDSGEAPEVVLQLSPPREDEAGRDVLPVLCLTCPFFQTDDGGFIFRPHTLTDRVARTDHEGRVLWNWSAGREPTLYSQEEWVAERRRDRERLFEYLNDRSPVPVGNPSPINEATLPEPGLRSVLGRVGPMGVDAEGRLWTLPAVDRGAPGEVDLFDSHGDYLGTIPTDDGPVAITVRGTWIAVAYEDELELATIRVYRIIG